MVDCFGEEATDVLAGVVAEGFSESGVGGKVVQFGTHLIDVKRMD